MTLETVRNSQVIDGPWNYRQVVNLAPLWAKHNYEADFGWPDRVAFNDTFKAYTRNGIAKAAVNKTIDKTWQTMPWLLEKPRDGSEGGGKAKVEETPLEAQLRKLFAKLRFWQQLMTADRMSMVGAYGGVILRLADNKPWNEEVTTVPGGINGLVGIIPAWEGQLTVSEWDTDERSPTYGEPKMYQFIESSIGGTTTMTGAGGRNVLIHPSRVVIWSEDATVRGRSSLEAGFNDLIDLEKVKGAGGEGFYKNARSNPVITIDKDAVLKSVASSMGTTIDGIADAMESEVRAYNAGFDKSLTMQGMTASVLQVSLPSPEHFFAAPLNSFAASMSIPVKILVGMQTGERASTEDANEWAQTNMSRRANETVPNILTVVDRLVAVNVLPEREWTIDWADLTEASMTDKIALADKMADVNVKMKDTGELIFTGEEMRAIADKEPLSDADKMRDDTTAEDEAAALTPKADPKKEA